MEAVAERKTHHDNPHLGERNEFIEKNLMLVHKVCQQFKGRILAMNLDYDDIFQVGVIGLIKAYEGFNPDAFDGVNSFSTYGFPKIFGEIQRYFRESHRGIKYPRQAKTIAHLITINNWFDKAPEEIAELTEEKIMYVHDALHLIKHGTPDSMDKVVFENDGDSVKLQDQIPDSEDYTTIIVEDFKAGLSERDKKMVELLLKNKTQTEIGEVIGVSQVQVSRMIPKLQKQLTDYLNETNAQRPIIPLPVKKEEEKPMEQEAKATLTCTKENYLSLKAKGISDNQIAVKYFGMKSGANLYHCLVQWGIKTKAVKKEKEKTAVVEATYEISNNVQRKDITTLMKALLDGQEVSIKEESTAKNIMQALDLIGAKYSKEQAFMVKLA